MPRETIDGIVTDSGRLVDAVHWVEHPDRLLDAGDEVDGWRVHVLPGHADGHIVLERDGVVLAGDTILMGITPAIGLYPNSRPDPLGDYLESLRWYEERAPRVAYTGHREPWPTRRRAPPRSRSITRIASTAPRRRSTGRRSRPTTCHSRSSRTTCRRRSAASRPPSRWPISNGSSSRDAPPARVSAYVKPGDTIEA